MKFEYLVSIHSLKVKYEQVFPLAFAQFFSMYIDLSLCVCLQLLDSSGSKVTANAVGSRRQIEERALEKEEEDYFNQDRCIFSFVDYCMKFYKTSFELTWVP